MHEVRAAGVIFLMFQNEMSRGTLQCNSLSPLIKVKRKWSVMGSSLAVRSEGVTPEQQIKSRVCPLEWVGNVVCC